MKTSVKEVFKNKKYPKWIAGHAIFKDITNIDKVFPSIGLPNCTDEKVVDNLVVAKESAQELLRTILSNLSTRKTALVNFSEKGKIGKARREWLGYILSTFDALVNEITNHFNDCIYTDNNKISLKLSSDVFIENTKKAIFRKDQSIFRVYNKLNEMLLANKFAQMPSIDGLPEFKKFSVDNVPAKPYKIVFSSVGEEGIWDISTMSMRGVRSCQSWDDGGYKSCVIGSMIDPFVGIIYLTSGGKYNEYGSQMIRRCVVRYLIDGEKKKPFISIDNMYPSFETKVLDQFIAFLKSKVGDAIDVEYAPYSYGKKKEVYIPLTDIRKKLAEFSNVNDQIISSYQDTKFQDKSYDENSRVEPLFQKNSAKKERKFIKKFTEIGTKAISTVDEKVFPVTVQAPIMQLKGTSKNGDNMKYYCQELMRKIAEEFVSSVDKKLFTNSDTYIRRIYYNLFNRKEEIIGKQKNDVLKDLNSILNLKARRKLTVSHILAIMQQVMPAIESEMKPELMKVVAKRKFSGALPLPEPSNFKFLVS